ncbi:MAG: c-type cytochrome, partial [Aliidongia sp.]
MPVGRKITIAALALLLVLGAGAIFYKGALPGLGSARPEPPAAESAIATWLLRHSVPEADRRQTNPLGGDRTDIVAGHGLFQKNCEVCHGFDGAGRTAIGAAEYPRAPALLPLIVDLSDGELFYYIRNVV